MLTRGDRGYSAARQRRGGRQDPARRAPPGGGQLEASLADSRPPGPGVAACSGRDAPSRRPRTPNRSQAKRGRAAFTGERSKGTLDAGMSTAQRSTTSARNDRVRGLASANTIRVDGGSRREEVRQRSREFRPRDARGRAPRQSGDARYVPEYNIIARADRPGRTRCRSSRARAAVTSPRTSWPSAPACSMRLPRAASSRRRRWSSATSAQAHGHSPKGVLVLINNYQAIA